ncbi:kinase-like protein [Suhomyces tanzawaensis NRRL Y-17324]|uniref:Kinase-like protein n=1 Tax=Suhomyces tanzawaensis NRRL Y-17324 TaxID=984487 RepID=A0A1E4SL26_9ASCO|nr:kinase-like protein [Suhomyces tanzawaensis NRRL Y-17324]ODV80203.1 kinase-like protein [Suhomyces tanzawaensis NRRL Y-17324]
MDTLQSIPYFEDKFSKITINKSPTRKKKVYPPHLYPDGTNPKVPSLQETRAGSGKTVGPMTPSRVISSSKSFSTVKQPNEKRVLSYPLSEISTLKKDYQFSFMKETSSSLLKKYTSPKPHMPQVIPVSSTKKRNEYSRQLSQSLRSRRLVSSNCPPTDITNLSYASSAREVNDSPTKQSAYRNASQPLPVKKGDVFNRLYPGPSKPEKATLAPRNVQGYPSAYQKPQTRSTSYTSSTSATKIESLAQLYTKMYLKDPSLFSEKFDSSTSNNQFATPLDVTQISSTSLNAYEKEELSRKKEVYFVPNLAQPRKIDIKNYQSNFGFDDASGNYHIVPNDHINFRYEILSILGNGSFGKVVETKDHKSNKVVAIKIIKNDLNWSLQSLNEIKLLKFLNGTGPPTKLSNQPNTSILTTPEFPALSAEVSPYILKYFDHFNFRSHICIVSELLTLNLFTLLEQTDFSGFGLPIIKSFGSQILKGLKFLHSRNIMHCDVKPENIMIKFPTDPELTDVHIKIIDFGSSCFKNEVSYTYIQSRFYRAPEVMLGSKYNEKIDIWSLGCILAELFTGNPLLPGKNEYEQIGMIVDMVGAPKSAMILRQRGLIKKQLSKNFEQPTTNDKNLKKTLLFKLFDINGRLNVSLLNYYMTQSSNNPTFKTVTVASSASTTNRSSKPGSKHLGVVLGLEGMETADNKQFLQVLNSIFLWDPAERASVQDILQLDFFLGS